MANEEKLQRLKSEAIGSLQALLDSREKTLERFPGILGKSNDTGSATVTGKPDWVYVRIGNDETLTEAFNNRTSHRNGLPVIVGYDAAQPDLFQVLRIRNVYDDSSGTGGGSVGPHGPTHTWGDSDGDDVVYSRIRQLHDLRVYASDPASMTINVSDGIYIIGETVYYLASDTVDLTSSIPSTGNMRWVLIAINGSGLYTTDGTEATSVDLTDIPAPDDPSDWRLAAVLLKDTTTAVTDWPSDIMIVDLRFAGARSPSSGGGTGTWENMIIVAKTGGNYSTIGSAISAAGVDDHILIFSGDYAENVSFSGTYGMITGLVDTHKVGSYGVFITGSDDTGPVVTLGGQGLFGNFVVNRSLSGGAGDFIGIDASSVHYKHLTDLRVYIDGAASARDIYGLKLGTAAGHESSISRSSIVTENASSGETLLISGAGDVDIEFSEITNLDGNTAFSSSGTGSNIWVYQTRIKGDVSITGAGTYYFRNCRIEGDFTIAASGATVYLRDSYVNGNLTIGASDTLVLGPNAHQEKNKSISNSGTLIPLHFLDAGVGTKHFFGAEQNNWPTSLIVQPIGSVTSSNRAILTAYFTDYLSDTANYELVEMVAYDNGSTIAGMLRTFAAGTGTLRNLYLGTGNTPANMTYIDGSNVWTFPQNVDMSGSLTVDTINEHTGDAGVTIDGVLVKDNGVDMSGSLTVDTINEHTGDAGVTIDGVLIKDGNVDGVDVSAHAASTAAHMTSPRFYIDGILATGTEQGGAYIATHTLTIAEVYIYCKGTGSASSTIIDVNLNGVTIFTTQGNRPTLAYNDADQVAVSGTPDVTSLSAGDVLTIDIDQLATGAYGLSVVIAIEGV